MISSGRIPLNILRVENLEGSAHDGVAPLVSSLAQEFTHRQARVPALTDVSKRLAPLSRGSAAAESLEFVAGTTAVFAGVPSAAGVISYLTLSSPRLPPGVSSPSISPHRTRAGLGGKTPLSGSFTSFGSGSCEEADASPSMQARLPLSSQRVEWTPDPQPQGVFSCRFRRIFSARSAAHTARTKPRASPRSTWSHRFRGRRIYVRVTQRRHAHLHLRRGEPFAVRLSRAVEIEGAEQRVPAFWSSYRRRRCRRRAPSPPIGSAPVDRMSEAVAERRCTGMPLRAPHQSLGANSLLLASLLVLAGSPRRVASPRALSPSRCRVRGRDERA